MRASFSALAGHAGLDLVNTIEWRLDPGQRSDDLASYDSVLAWCAQFELVDLEETQLLSQLATRDPALAARERGAVVTLRESVYVIARNGDAEARQRALSSVAAHYAEAINEADLACDLETFAWVDQKLNLASPRYRIARLVNGLLTGSRVNLIRQCEDRACGYLFIDVSPRHNRRWCAAADCGNRNRARVYYERHRKSPH